MDCPRCGEALAQKHYGPCPACRDDLRRRAVDYQCSVPQIAFVSFHDFRRAPPRLKDWRD